MGLIDAEIEGAGIVRAFAGQLSALEIVLHAMSGGVEIERVLCAGGDVQLAHETSADTIPMALQIGGQVIVLLPISGNIGIDGAIFCIPEFSGITVLVSGTERG